MWFSLIVTGLLIVALLAIFFFGPIYSKRFKFIILPIFLAITVVLILIPNNVFADIKVPILNKSISGVVNEFLHTSPDFTNLVEYDPNISENVAVISASIVKASVASIFFGASLLITIAIGFFIKLGKKNGKVLLSTMQMLVVVILSAVFIVSPLATVVSINQGLDKSVARENENFRDTYPEFEKYELMFKLVEVFDFMTANDTVGNVLLAPVNTLSFTNLNKLTSDFGEVDDMLVLFREGGLNILYTDPDFDFSETVEGTFNFTKLKELVGKTLKTSILDNLARSFTNDILGHFENILQPPTGVSAEGKPTLKLTEEEFKTQYVEILDLMEQVVKYDLVEHATNMNTDSVIDLINKMEPDAFINLLAAIGNNPMVKKIDDYLKTDNELTAGIYTCIRMYDAMNSWLNDFRETEFYRTAEEFLTNKGVFQ